MDRTVFVDPEQDAAIGLADETTCTLAAGRPDDHRAMLLRAGLKPTRQRMHLAALLFGSGHRHVTAEQIAGEARAAGDCPSMATVYNTLNALTRCGLLRRIGPDPARAYFDTDTSVHPHYFVGREDRLFDMPDPARLLRAVPAPLPGYEIARVDVVVHLRRKQR